MGWRRARDSTWRWTKFVLLFLVLFVAAVFTFFF